MSRFLNFLWLPMVILAVWEAGVAVKLLDPLLFPPPSALGEVGVQMVRDGELPQQLGITLNRMLTGYAIGAGAGLICGILMGASGVIRRSLEPVISALYTTPKLALLPLLILLMGVGEQVRITLIALACFILVAIHGLDGVQNLNPLYKVIARNHGANWALVVRRVYVPAVLPQLFTGLRLAMGRALTVTIALELVSCPDGMGHMLWIAMQTFAAEKLYVGVIVIAGLGTSLHWLLRRAELMLIPWKPR